MEKLIPKALKAEATERLKAARVNPKHLILLNTGVVVALGLLVSGVNFLLGHQIGSTGGLSGLGMRSVLQTIQSLLGTGATLFTPFWAAGLLYCFALLLQNQEVRPASMLQGFRRVTKILSFSLLQLGAMLLVVMPLTYLASFLFLLTPVATKFAAVLLPMLESGSILTAAGAVDLSLIPTELMISVSVSMGLICLLVYTPAFLFLSYSFHMGPYLIVTDQARGGPSALMMSMQLVRGHRMELFRLDLSYWWYYLLQAVGIVILYLDLLLPLLGITPGLDPTGFYFLTLIGYSGINLALDYWKKDQKLAAFVLAYERLAHPAEEEGLSSI